jgi:competence protein ComEC
MFERLREMPFAALTACLTAGIVTSRFVGNCYFPLLAAGTAFLVAASAIAFARDRLCAAAGISCSTVVLCGLVVALADDPGIAGKSVPLLLARNLLPLGQLVQFEGCVMEDVRQYGDETLLTLDLRGYRFHDQWMACRGGVYVRMPRTGTQEPESVLMLRPGDRVSGWATWQAPRSYLNPGAQDRAELLRQRGIHLVGRVKSPRILETLPGDCGDPLGSLVSAVRGRLRGALERLKDEGKQQQAAILSSIVLGDATGLDPETRDAFQNSGTYHVLVVSGLHVVWIAWVLLRAFKWLRVPDGACRALIILGIVGYTAVVGNQTSISRALWTYALYALGEAIYRRGHPANIALASAFLLLVLCPRWLFDTGFQLSFLSVLAITLTGVPIENEVLQPLLHPSIHAGRDDYRVLYPGSIGRLGRRMWAEGELLAEAIGDRHSSRLHNVALAAWRILARIALAAGSMVLVSIAVQIWLEPLLAYYFNRLSWISPLANLVVVPFSSIVLAIGGIATIIASVSTSPGTFLAPAGWLASLLFALARWISGFPGAWVRCPTPPGAWVLAAILVLFTCGVLSCRRRWLPCLGTGAILAALVLAPPPSRWWSLTSDRAGGRPLGMLPSAGTLQLTFLDVGQGDCTVIRFPDSRVWVVDAGGTRISASEQDRLPAFDVGDAVVSRYLWHLWVRTLGRLVLSHPHQDHGGGLPALLRNFTVGDFVYGDTGSDPILGRIKAAAERRRVPAHRITSGRSLAVGAVHITVLAPPENDAGRSANDGSVVLHLTYGRFSALLPGDVERTTEGELVSLWENGLRSDLVKIAHHGSPSSTTDAFLDRALPRWAVISAARNNPFGNPAPEVVLRLARRGTLPLLTMDHGALTFETDGVYYVLASHVGGVLARGSLPPTTP